MKAIDRNSIPVEMRQAARWLGWNWQKKFERWGKVPVGTSTNAESWSDFDTVWQSYQSGETDGIGFALGDGFVGIDLDECLADGELTPFAHEIVKVVDTYCEASPTGTGIKLYCKGMLAAGKTKNPEGTLELYTSGRFFCVTGDKLSGQFAERQAELESLRSKYIDQQPAKSPVLASMLAIRPKALENDGSNRLFAYACRAVESNLSDDVAIEMIREVEKKFPFPIAYSDSDIFARLRQAEEKTERGIARTQIMLGTDIPRVVEETIRALAESDVYQHLSHLAEIQLSPPQCKYAAVDNGAPRIGLVPPGVVLEKLTTAADFYKSAAKGQLVQCLPPDYLKTAIYQRGQYPGIRVLNGVVSRPILLPDGRIVTTGGYNAETGLYLNTDGEWPVGMSTDEGVAKLLDIWCDFPFDTESSRSACLAAQLTLLTRQIIRGNVPLHVVDGNRSRVGKGLLSDTWTMISEGRRASRYTFTNPVELKKYLTSLAVRGGEYIVFDNLQGKFGNPVIEAAITTGSISDRILNVSEIVDVPLPITWLGTGNGYTCSHDMAGRTSPIFLDTVVSNPEARSGFKHENLLNYVQENRRELLIAGLSIVSNFIQTGAPKPDVPNFGGFEEWSNLIRGAIVWAGLADPLRDREKLREVSEDASDPVLLELADAWTFTGPTTVKDAIAAATSDNSFVRLKCVLDSSEKGTNKPEYLGKLLRRSRGQNLGGRKFDRTSHSTAKWFLTNA